MIRNTLQNIYIYIYIYIYKMIQVQRIIEMHCRIELYSIFASQWMLRDWVENFVSMLTKFLWLRQGISGDWQHYWKPPKNVTYLWQNLQTAAVIMKQSWSFVLCPFRHWTLARDLFKFTVLVFSESLLSYEAVKMFLWIRRFSSYALCK